MNFSARNGVAVSSGGNHFPLGGAEPLSSQRLSVGHPDCDRPSCISQRLETKDIASDFQKIAIAEDAQKRKAEEEIRSGPGGKG